MLIPSPALSEILVRVEAEQVDKYLKMIRLESAFGFAHFEEESAIEVATMSRKAKEQGDNAVVRQKFGVKSNLTDRLSLSLKSMMQKLFILTTEVCEQVGLKVISSHELEIP